MGWERVGVVIGAGLAFAMVPVYNGGIRYLKDRLSMGLVGQIEQGNVLHYGSCVLLCIL